MPITKEHYNLAILTESENPECERTENCVVSVAFMDLLRGLGLEFSSVSYNAGDKIEVYRLELDEDAPEEFSSLEERLDWMNSVLIGTASVSAGASSLAVDYDSILDGGFDEERLLKSLPKNVVVKFDKTLEKQLKQIKKNKLPDIS